MHGTAYCTTGTHLQNYKRISYNTTTAPTKVTRAFANQLWFHTSIDQKTAEDRLKRSPHKNCFLIRESMSNPGPENYSLTLKYQEMLTNYTLCWNKRQNTFEIVGTDEVFSSPEELIKFYTSTPLSTRGETLGVPLKRPSPSRTRYVAYMIYVTESLVLIMKPRKVKYQ